MELANSPHQTGYYEEYLEERKPRRVLMMIKSRLKIRTKSRKTLKIRCILT